MVMDVIEEKLAVFRVFQEAENARLVECHVDEHGPVGRGRPGASFVAIDGRSFSLKFDNALIFLGE